MNSTPDPGGPQPTKAPLSEAAKASLARTRSLFRMFIVSVLGAYFVYQLDVGYLWLTAILTAASIALGIVLLVREAKYRQSRLVMFGAISGLVVSAVMALVIMVTALFYGDVSDYQACERRALTDQAHSSCMVQLQDAFPGAP